MTSLSGSTLPNPQDPEITDDWEGQRSTSHDGTVLIDYTNLSRLKWELEWLGMTPTNRNTLWTAYSVAASQTFVPPHTSASYAALIVRGSWKEKIYKRGTRDARYDVSFELEEKS